MDSTYSSSSPPGGHQSFTGGSGDTGGTGADPSSAPPALGFASVDRTATGGLRSFTPVPGAPVFEANEYAVTEYAVTAEHPQIMAAPVIESASVLTFSDFYTRHYDSVARALSINLGSADLGKSATDEAMTRAYAKWNEVSGYANPSGWVYRVGLNWARSWRRRSARRLPWSERQEVSMPETADPALAKAIADLDVKYRDVVVCRYYLDWSTEQTAEALDIRAGTVKSRLSTGIATLRAAVGA